MGAAFKLLLKDKAAVFVDWANVYGWEESLKRVVDPRKLYLYLKAYREIRQIRFYFGTDKHPKSKAFLVKIERLGYQVVTKPVKYILIAEVKGQKVYKRKCDFDMEIALDVYRLLKEDVKSFVFFSGDGDFEPLYQFLLGLKKQVIVVYASGHVGREILKLERQIFLCNIKKIIRTFP